MSATLFENGTGDPGTSAPKPQWTRKKIVGWLVGAPLGGLIFLILVGALLGDTPAETSGGKTPAHAASTSPADLASYAGKWRGQDGTSIWIRGDGKGDYDFGSTKVQGGGVTLDEAAKTLRISSFFGIGKTWAITVPPHAANGHTEMTLAGIVYRRQDGFEAEPSDAPETSAPPATTVTSVVPPQKEQRRLVRETLWEFDRALRDKDFSTFYRTTAKAWQAQTTPQEIKAAFSGFIEKKIRLTRTLKELKPVFSPEPRIAENGMLELSGFYPSFPNQTRFKLGFLNEDGAWKLAILRIKIGEAL